MTLTPAKQNPVPVDINP